MSAVMGPNLPASIVAEAHAGRALDWAQLSDLYKQYARTLHNLALGEHPERMDDIGPIYVRQALAMQRARLKFTE